MMFPYFIIEHITNFCTRSKSGIKLKLNIPCRTKHPHIANFLFLLLHMYGATQMGCEICPHTPATKEPSPCISACGHPHVHENHGMVHEQRIHAPYG